MFDTKTMIWKKITVHAAHSNVIRTGHCAIPCSTGILFFAGLVSERRTSSELYHLNLFGFSSQRKRTHPPPLTFPLIRANEEPSAPIGSFQHTSLRGIESGGGGGGETGSVDEGVEYEEDEEEVQEQGQERRSDTVARRVTGFGEHLMGTILQGLLGPGPPPAESRERQRGDKRSVRKGYLRIKEVPLPRGGTVGAQDGGEG
eukprot:gene66-65_t